MKKRNDIPGQKIKRGKKITSLQARALGKADFHDFEFE